MNQNKNLRAKIIYKRFWGTNFLDLFITFFQREVQFYHSWCENTKALSKHLTIVIFIKQHVKIFKENFICDEYFWLEQHFVSLFFVLQESALVISIHEW